MNDHVTIRKARWTDKDLLFSWRNLPEIVALSASGKSVEYKEHLNWFKNYLDRCGLMFIIKNKNEPVGQLRFDKLDANKMAVTIYLIPNKTGQSIGRSAFNQGLDYLRKEVTLPIILVANIKDTNAPSIKFFKKLGFRMELKENQDGLLRYCFRVN